MFYRWDIWLFCSFYTLYLDLILVFELQHPKYYRYAYYYYCKAVIMWGNTNFGIARMFHSTAEYLKVIIVFFFCNIRMWRIPNKKSTFIFDSGVYSWPIHVNTHIGIVTNTQSPNSCTSRRYMSNMNVKWTLIFH